MFSVEVIRVPGNDEPRIIVQRREDEETFALTVAEAHTYLEENVADACGNRPEGAAFHANTAHREGQCLWCAICDAVEGIR